MRFDRSIGKSVTAIAFLLALAVRADAAIQTKAVEYEAGGTKLKGTLAWDDALKGKRPAVLVVHEWWGLNDYAVGRAKQLAGLGYVALAIDMFGEGKSTTHPKEAMAFITELGQKEGAAKERFLAGMKLLEANPHVDASRIAAIGYCFGGSTVLKMAMAGVGLKGVVSFHGSLGGIQATEGVKVGARILVCHGADDTFIAPEHITAFQDAARKAGADWQFISYSGAIHGFTNPAADTAGLDGVKYNKVADQRSWALMKSFLAEVFGR